MKTYSTIPEPTYHMGYVIQPTWEGYEVYDRTDTRVYKGKYFDTIGEALDYINDRLEFEDA